MISMVFDRWVFGRLSVDGQLPRGEGEVGDLQSRTDVEQRRDHLYGHPVVEVDGHRQPGAPRVAVRSLPVGELLLDLLKFRQVPDLIPERVIFQPEIRMPSRIHQIF